MKRYRIIKFDFDSRSLALDPVQENWEESVKEHHRQNQKRTMAWLKFEYGESHFEVKLQNFKDLGVKPFSVVAFHNRLLAQSRHAFITGQYYPALTGACALGERILNHLIIGLRDSYKSHSQYKKIYQKSSFDSWPMIIDTLSEWGVLTVEATASFRLLHQKRNNALHFNLTTELNDRQFAIDAIKNIEEIVGYQFSAFGELPWLLMAPGECFIKKEFESSPFVQLVYLPNCAYLGYRHVVTNFYPWEFQDAYEYQDQEVPDKEFLRLRQEFQQTSQIK